MFPWGFHSLCDDTGYAEGEPERGLCDSLFVSRSDLVVEHRADPCLSQLFDAVLPIDDGQECCKWLLAPG